MEKKLFGTMPDGRSVEQYTLQAGNIACDIITYGGAVRAVRVPDQNGQEKDIVLGFDTLEDYRRQDKYIGALVGRYANRIGGARFALNGKEYTLAANNGENHLHGGLHGFNSQVWQAQEAGENTLVLTLVSPDGQENYPGTLRVKVTYTLTEEALSIDYEAESDKDTLCNLTNHSYFNLAGQESGPVEAQCIQLFADFYTPTDAGSIPTGEVAAVEGTPMDLRRLTPIGAKINEDFIQLKQAKGYDHNWVVNGQAGTLRPAARAFSPQTGITLEVLTTQPGIQFYAGNYLHGSPAGKSGALYDDRWGFALETQNYPDAPNKPQFPGAVLRAGKVYHEKTVFRFGTEKGEV